MIILKHDLQHLILTSAPIAFHDISFGITVKGLEVEAAEQNTVVEKTRISVINQCCGLLLLLDLDGKGIFHLFINQCF